MRTVLDVAALGSSPIVWLGVEEKLSPGALLVQLTRPQGKGSTVPNAMQLICTTKGSASRLPVEPV